MAKLTPQQRAYIRRRTKVHDPDPSEIAGELNIVPFLDIVVNLIMFLLATSEAVLGHRCRSRRSCRSLAGERVEAWLLSRAST